MSVNFIPGHIMEDNFFGGRNCVRMDWVDTVTRSTVRHPVPCFSKPIVASGRAGRRDLASQHAVGMCQDTAVLHKATCPCKFSGVTGERAATVLVSASARTSAVGQMS